jgi:hypothetical protein
VTVPENNQRTVDFCDLAVDQPLRFVIIAADIL